MDIWRYLIVFAAALAVMGMGVLAFGSETPVTATTFLGVDHLETFGQIPYALSALAVVGVSLLTQFLKVAANLPKWAAYCLPTVISILIAATTALSQGFYPWQPAGLNILMATLIGGWGAQGGYMLKYPPKKF